MKVNRKLALLFSFAFFICACALLGYAIFHLSLQDEMLPPEAPQRNETQSLPSQGIDMNVCLLFYWIFLGVGIVGMFYLVAMRRGREVMHAFFGALLAVLILMGILYVMAVNNVQENQSSNVTSNASGNPGTTPMPATSPAPPMLSMLLVSVMFVLIGIILVGVLVSFLAGREGRKGVAKRTFSMDMVKAIDEGIALFETGISARDAIIRCYKRMTELLALHGVKDALYMTPREFREEANAKLGFESKHLDSLVELFEMARYSSHEITEREKARALNALKEFRKEVEVAGA